MLWFWHPEYNKRNTSIYSFCAVKKFENIIASKKVPYCPGRSALYCVLRLRNYFIYNSISKKLNKQRVPYGDGCTNERNLDSGCVNLKNLIEAYQGRTFKQRLCSEGDRMNGLSHLPIKRMTAFFTSVELVVIKTFCTLRLFYLLY